MVPLYPQNVFLNCPFDGTYQSLFEAIVFAVVDCGFRLRCALEIDDGGQTRIEKIFNLISDCRFGIHDISKTELDDTSGLPRFNMPLELGIFLGARRYGQKEQREKICLILDRERYRYQKFISDISGQDIRSHGGNPGEAIALVRNWLRSVSPSDPMPGGEEIFKRYQVFRGQLSELCQAVRLSVDRLTYIDYTWLVSVWLKKNPLASETS
jgi:hypothetical protein